MKNTIIIVLLLIAIVLLGGNMFLMYRDKTMPVATQTGNEEGNSQVAEAPETQENSGEEGETIPETEIIDPIQIIEETKPEIIVQEEVEIDEDDEELPVDGEYDVIVVGAEPEGIIASISAARSNLKVLLLEKRDGPGGLMTYGMLNTIDMNQNKEGVLLSKGLFSEFYQNIGNRGSFDVAEVKTVFEKMLADEDNIEVIYNVKNFKVGSDGTQVEYIIADDKKYVARTYIDCTQDADITVAAGGQYVIGWEDVNEKGRSMSATLVIHMGNFDWDAACKAIDEAKVPNEGHSSTGIWAFKNITSQYIPSQSNMRLKGLNIGRQKDGSVLINSLQIIDSDTLDENAKAKAYEKCVKEAKNFSEFLIKNVPGFSEAYLIGVAPELYVRETRHIIGENRLTVRDMLESKYYNNSIGMACYPIDIQTTSIYDYGYIIGAPMQYFLPMGVIIPKGYTNLLTVGRSSSYTSIAAGSARVIPTGMTLAESAGIMASIAKERNTDFQKMLKDYSMIKDVQMRMGLRGMYLVKESKPVIDVNGRYYKFIIDMCEKGILSLGYSNVFNPDETMSEREYIVFLQTYLKRSFIPDEFWNVSHINLLSASENPITPSRAKEIMIDITTHDVKDAAVKTELEDYINTVMPNGKEDMSLVRIYEIATMLRERIERMD